MRNKPDGVALINAKHWGLARFKKEVAKQRKRGCTDAEIVQAMVDSPALVDAIGSMPAPRRPRYGRS